MTDYPLVSCVTPTFNRREFFPRAIKCFLAYDYSPLEWVIVDNGQDSIKDTLPDDPRIKYYRFEGAKLTHGRLMNECFARAEGEFCIVADDDDFYLPDRVSKQIQPMLDDPTIQVTGTSRLYYYLHGTQRAFRYQNISQKKWIGAIAVRKSAWETRKFADKPHGADFDLLQQIPFDQWCDLNDLGLLVAAIHSTNAASKSLSSPSLVEEPWATIEGILDA